MRRVHLVSVLALVLLILAQDPADAQDVEPIRRFVIDARGSLARLGTNEVYAADRDLTSAQLPSTGYGLDVGGHVYVWRWRAITFGVGASYLWSRGGKDPEPVEETVPPVVPGPHIQTRFTAFSPQLSFNFGDGDGWSYISGGLGQSRHSVFAAAATEPAQRSARTLNYGGGARWFVQPHMAFTFDLRFYAISPLEETDEEPGSPRMTLMVFNVGLAFK